MNAGVVRLIGVWAVLMALLGLTIAIAFLPLGPAKPALGYLIAASKTALLLWFFMEMRSESGLVRLGAAAGFIWLVVLFGLSATDYLTRG